MLGREPVVDSASSLIPPKFGMKRPRLLVDTRLPIDDPSAFSFRCDTFLPDRLLRGGASSSSVQSDEDVLPWSFTRRLPVVSLDSSTSIGLDTTKRGGARGEASGYGGHMACISLVQDVRREPNNEEERDEAMDVAENQRADSP